jgi:hypothetical protein
VGVEGRNTVLEQVLEKILSRKTLAKAPVSRSDT